MLILTDREKSHPSPTHRRSPLLPFNPFSKQLPKESCSMLVGSCQSSAPNPPRVCHRTLRAIRIVRPDLVPTTLSPPLLLLSLHLLCFPPQLSPSLLQPQGPACTQTALLRLFPVILSQGRLYMQPSPPSACVTPHPSTHPHLLHLSP